MLTVSGFCEGRQPIKSSRLQIAANPLQGYPRVIGFFSYLVLVIHGFELVSAGKK